MKKQRTSEDISIFDIFPEKKYDSSNWTVVPSTRLRKQLANLPNDVKVQLMLLMKGLEVGGPHIKKPHFGKLKGAKDCYHCHLRSGRPTYVACWRKLGPKTIEVYYAGTHSDAPY